MKDFLKHFLKIAILALLIGLAIAAFISIFIFVENPIWVVTLFFIYIVTLASILTYKKP